MIELALTLWLTSGQIITETITEAHCRELIGIARYVDATGGTLTRDGAGAIARVRCGEWDYVLMLPPSSGPCEVA